ncbi:MAG: cohesin domain-containing protein [Saccharofermentanales bacterium]
MKKGLTSILLIIILCSSFTSMSVYAAGSLTVTLKPGSGTIRAGETITVTGKIDSTVPIATFDLKVSYDAGTLVYVKAEAIGLTAGSTLDIVKGNDGIQFLYLDGAGENAAIKSANFFKITFTVKSDVVAGAKTEMNSIVDVAGDGAGEPITAVSKAVSMTIGAPLSVNNYLSALTVDKGALTPAFEKMVKTYSLAVPFEVSSIFIKATAEDAKAKAAVSGNTSLKAGAATKVLVTVTAENGVKRIYTIQVTRGADPDAVSSQAVASSPASSAASSEAAGSSEDRSSSEVISSIASAASAISSEAPPENDPPVGVPLWIVAAVAVLAAAAGFAAGYFVKR